MSLLVMKLCISKCIVPKEKHKKWTCSEQMQHFLLKIFSKVSESFFGSCFVLVQFCSSCLMDFMIWFIYVLWFLTCISCFQCPYVHLCHQPLILSQYFSSVQLLLLSPATPTHNGARSHLAQLFHISWSASVELLLYSVFSSEFSSALLLSATVQ